MDPAAASGMLRPMTPSAKSGFSRLNVVPRSTYVREQLQEAIRRGDYRPGDRLPPERELAELFGVSRLSVREAIRWLAAVGVVEVRQGAGSTVLDPSQWAAPDPARRTTVNRGEMLELLRVRSALDELAGVEAAARGDSRGIAAIRGAQEAFKAAVDGGDVEQLAQLDTAFHVAIADASGNGLLRDVLAELHAHITESRAVYFMPEGRSARSAAEHDVILDMIDAGDSAGARQAIARHVASVRAIMESA